jgi:hypothetical protein
MRTSSTPTGPSTSTYSYKFQETVGVDAGSGHRLFPDADDKQKLVLTAGTTDANGRQLRVFRKV